MQAKCVRHLDNKLHERFGEQHPCLRGEHVLRLAEGVHARLDKPGTTVNTKVELAVAEGQPAATFGRAVAGVMAAGSEAAQRAAFLRAYHSIGLLQQGP